MRKSKFTTGEKLEIIQGYPMAKELLTKQPPETIFPPKDYEPKREVYMATAKRKTNTEERKSIVEHCITYGNDYKGTAELYDDTAI